MGQKPGPTPGLELWGGIECTRNRVGDEFFDQVAWSGHADRPDDLERMAALGIRTLRYPVLWEWAVDDDPGGWSWADDRLPQLRDLGVRPVVGLVHHGSGPRHTRLDAPTFAAGLARFAGRLAERFPWLDLFTPVNEPLTTARFAGLYGHWFPHGRDNATFARALLNQCRAVVLAMRAVRRVNPFARLVQTEDLGQTHATPALRYQADFENERRWLTFDLLCGRVDRCHPLASYFDSAGLAEWEWAWFADNPCPPDIVGVNHYLTSERYLDEDVGRYPPGCRGGNGRVVYADVEAVRAGCVLAGAEGVLRQAWERYRLPLAVTEVHLGCTREDQVRWAAEVWQAARRARAAGADVRAVTLWALLGSFDWDTLVTKPRGHYEPGVFDLRSPGNKPRPTALAGLARELAAGKEPSHPCLGSPGWWHRPERLYHPVPGPGSAAGEAGRPLLIAGATGTLGRAFGRLCAGRGIPVRLLGRGEFDITSPAGVAAALAAHRPWAVVNAAGYVRVDDAEREPERCLHENALGPRVLAEACAGAGIGLLTFSSDLVFDGRAAMPYAESAGVCPLSVYGRSKAEAERAVQAAHPGALVVRTSAFFGPWDRFNFVAAALQALRGGGAFAAADDLYVSPTYVPDLVHASLDLLLDGEAGVWHLANAGAVTWADLASRAARGAGLDETAVEGRPAATFGWPAPRPAYSALCSERGYLLPALDDALGRYLCEAVSGEEPCQR